MTKVNMDNIPVAQEGKDFWVVGTYNKDGGITQRNVKKNIGSVAGKGSGDDGIPTIELNYSELGWSDTSGGTYFTASLFEENGDFPFNRNSEDYDGDDYKTALNLPYPYNDILVGKSATVRIRFVDKDIDIYLARDFEATNHFLRYYFSTSNLSLRCEAIKDAELYIGEGGSAPSGLVLNLGTSYVE